MRPLRITVVTSGHLSTTPRMLKAADAFADHGYAVRVVSTRLVNWAWEADEVVARTRTWRWTAIDATREGAAAAWIATAARARSARFLSGVAGADRVPMVVAARAYGRLHDELAAAAAAEPADFLYGGTSGALAATAEAARRLGVPFGLDLEDFHPGDQSGADAALDHALADRLLRDVWPRASLLTTSSNAMADAYSARYGSRPTTIHNTFPLPEAPPLVSTADAALRVYWFSQTIGPGRGLDVAVKALGLAGIPAELHVRGRDAGYAQALVEMQRVLAPSLSVRLHPPALPDDMVGLARGFDAGLSIEMPVSRNRDICVANKVFTYLLAGVPVILSDTTAHCQLAVSLGEAAFVVPVAAPERLAALFRAWAADRHLRARAGAAAWYAARTRWHWEHPLERGTLLAAVERALCSPPCAL